VGRKIIDAVIAIPSHFDESQRRATREASFIAGFNVLRFLNEATAAILAYGNLPQNQHGEKNILVFDWGGGTLDVSIATIGEGVYEVKCIEGDSRLGGDDFDKVIEDFILDTIRKKYGNTLELNQEQRMLLKEAAEKAKKDLSAKQISNIFYPGFLRIGSNFHDLNITIDRPTFESLSKDLFNKAFSLLSKALNSINMDFSNLDALLLLGGSSRIPYIKNKIKREFKIEPFTGVNPETCVAEGAIIQAGVFIGEIKDVLLLDALPSSYGIALESGKFFPILPKNITTPHKFSKIFTTTADNQKSILINIYQGESQKTSENVFLGTLELTGILPAKAGTPQIEITFAVDCNTIVEVSAKDIATGKEKKVTIKSPYGLNEKQIGLMALKLDQWRALNTNIV
jgi:molecular chaperone DnaK